MNKKNTYTTNNEGYQSKLSCGNNNRHLHHSPSSCYKRSSKDTGAFLSFCFDSRIKYVCLFMSICEIMCGVSGTKEGDNE